jgi:formate/nitrite transporter FocA (FNT family)
MALLIQYFSHLEMTSTLITLWDAMRNLLLVIIGNLIGGCVFVGLVYHIIYQRNN